MRRGSHQSGLAREGHLRGEGLVPVAAAVAILGADAVTKAWASRQVDTVDPTSGGFLQLRHLTNAGATLGLWVTASGAVERLAVAVVLGGAAGNLRDRVLNGAVTDWLHVVGYAPSFNLADVAIRLGALVAVVARVRSWSRTANSGALRKSTG